MLLWLRSILSFSYQTATLNEELNNLHRSTDTAKRGCGKNYPK